MRKSWFKLDRYGFAWYVPLPERRNFTLRLGWRTQMIAAWRARPFPRAPQWQCEISHHWRRGSWSLWPTPSFKSEERQFESVWLVWSELRWGTWTASWSHELPPSQRKRSLRPLRDSA